MQVLYYLGCIVLTIVLVFLIIILIDCLQNDISSVILPLIGISSVASTLRLLIRRINIKS